MAYRVAHVTEMRGETKLIDEVLRQMWEQGFSLSHMAVNDHLINDAWWEYYTLAFIYAPLMVVPPGQRHDTVTIVPSPKLKV